VDRGRKREVSGDYEKIGLWGVALCGINKVDDAIREPGVACPFGDVYKKNKKYKKIRFLSS